MSFAEQTEYDTGRKNYPAIVDGLFGSFLALFLQPVEVAAFEEYPEPVVAFLIGISVSYRNAETSTALRELSQKIFHDFF